MNTFVQRFGENILGSLHGLDRLRLRGTKRLLAHVGGMLCFLWHERVLLKDFGTYANALTEEVRRSGEAVAAEHERPVQYLASSAIDKEALARQIAKRDEIHDGLICVLKTVEPCWSYEVHRNRERKELELRGGQRKCLHLYHYFLDAQLGLVHVRLQTWFPFSVHVCLNGREWLARHMDREGLTYERRDNCFTWVSDWQRAQELLDDQLRTNWPKLLERLAQQANPALPKLFQTHPVPYYWSAEESEWASDVAFASRRDLAELMPRLVRHGMLQLGSDDVMRFLGRKPDGPGARFGRFAGEVVSDWKRRVEGMRVKHRLKRNWIKMYDKQGSVLRVETVINDARDMKSFRPKEGDASGAVHLQPLRKGVADLHARAQLCQNANDRYFNALATVEDHQPLGELAAKVCQPVRKPGRRARALNPLAPDDAALLEAVNRGEFTLHGFRNRDLRVLLLGATPSDPCEQRRQSGRITRKLRLLRAHGLIRKIPKSHRYQISDQGRTIIAALLAARHADSAKLTKAA